MNNSFLRGTGVALVTPFHNDNSIDFESLSKLVNYVIDGGIDYLVVMGTTGESVVLNNEERLSILKHIQQVNNGRLPIVYGMGGNNTSSLVESIEQQDFTGIDAILSVCPYYNKPTQSGLIAHFSEVAKASPVPVVLYNVPSRTGSWLSPQSTIELANKYENIVATKGRSL